MSILALLGGLTIGGVLAGAGLSKLLRPYSAALRVLGALELATAIGLLALGPPAMIFAALLLWGFAGWQWLEVARGHTGAPCPCFGARTTIGPRWASATLGLALLASALAIQGAPGGGLSAAVSLALACAVLAILALALGAIALVLAREVADLRLRLHRTPPRTALEILDEGPAIGRESPLIERFGRAPGELALAVFVSPGCAICHELEPAIVRLAAQPGLELVVFDEQRDQLAWHSGSIPGSPYAVAMTPRGLALAKGTFNTPEQLESVPATARMRMREGLAHV